MDDHTVRITTAGPDPSLWLKLADVAIIVAGLGRAARRGSRVSIFQVGNECRLGVLAV
jgi:hypothetical protein